MAYKGFCSRKCFTFNSPAPCLLRVKPASEALSFIFRLIVSLEALGYFSRYSAIAPDTTGVDIDVPLFAVYPLYRLWQLIILCPGASRSGLFMLHLVGPSPERETVLSLYPE